MKKEIKYIEISCYNNRKLQNWAKKNGLEIKPITELKNIYGKHYANVVVDKVISVPEGTEIPCFEKIDYEDVFSEKFRAKYPFAPENEEYAIIEHYCMKGRKPSKEIINRLDNLVVAHVRHNYTDYDDYVCSSEDRNNFRTTKNISARSIISDWRQSDKTT